MYELSLFRHYATAPQQFSTSKLGLGYGTGESTYQSVPKERPELALHIGQNHQHQSEPQLQQLQIQVQLQQQQQQHQQTAAASPHQQQHQGLLSPGLSFTGSGEHLYCFQCVHVRKNVAKGTVLSRKELFRREETCAHHIRSLER